VDLDGVTVSFQNAAELSGALAASPEVSECFTRQWLRYALDRFEQGADEAAVAYLADNVGSATSSASDLIVEITRTLPFSHRAPAQGEVLTP
jgi:hypothetical protein